MGIAYSVKNVTKVFPKPRVVANDRISLDIEEGCIFGLLGPNGAGKTTLIRQMVGLLRPTSGSILLEDVDVARTPEAVPWRIGYVSQRVSSLRAFTMREVLVHCGVHRGLRVKAAKLRALELLAAFECEGVADRPLYALSGGEARAALFLTAFIGNQRVLVLDEPTNELDVRRRAAAWQLLLEANRKLGTTIILVTHSVLEAETVVDQVAIIANGKVIANGTPGQLKSGHGGKARVVVTLKPGVESDLLRSLGEHVHGQTWVVRAPSFEVGGLFNSLVDRIGFESIDDFRVLTPSLEDVYVDLTGGRWDELTGRVGA